MFVAALFTVAKGWKQPKCPSTDEWMSNMWSIHMKEYYLDIKSNEVLTHAAIRVNLENILLSEINQTHEDKYCVSLLL